MKTKVLPDNFKEKKQPARKRSKIFVSIHNQLKKTHGNSLLLHSNTQRNTSSKTREKQKKKTSEFVTRLKEKIKKEKKKKDPCQNTISLLEESIKTIDLLNDEIRILSKNNLDLNVKQCSLERKNRVIWNEIFETLSNSEYRPSIPIQTNKNFDYKKEKLSDSNNLYTVYALNKLKK